MSNEVYYMTKADGGTGVYELKKGSGGWEEYMLKKTPSEDPYIWISFGTISFNIQQATTIYNNTIGHYIGGIGPVTLTGCDQAKIVYNGGSFYRGAVLNDYRTSVGFKSKKDSDAGPDRGFYTSASLAIAGSSGKQMILDLGTDSTIYYGSLFAAGVPVDAAGVVTFRIYGRTQ